MKRLYRRLTKPFRRAKHTMIIREGVRVSPPRYPGLRNLWHKIKRTILLCLLASVAHAQGKFGKYDMSGSTISVRCLNAAGTAYESCAGSSSSSASASSAVVTGLNSERLATRADQATAQTTFDSILSALQGTLRAAVSQFGAWTVTPGTGTWAVSGTFWQATQPVSGTFWQATQPISGSVSISALPAETAFTAGLSSPTAVASLGSTTGKTLIAKTGTLTTTSKTAGQSILSYTATSGRILYITGGDIQASATSFLAINGPLDMGTVTLETPSGTVISSYTVMASSTVPVYSIELPRMFEPIFVPAPALIRCLVTPNTTIAVRWICNLIGYEKP